MIRKRRVAAWMALSTLVFGGTVFALDLIVNGDFETGDLSGWTVANQEGGSGDWYIQSGENSPLSMLPVPNPPQGVFAAMTDQEGAGTHVLYQDFVIPEGRLDPGVRLNVAFDYFLGNRADGFASPASLDYLVQPNQQVRVDLMRPGSDPFSVDDDDVIFTILRTLAGDSARPIYLTPNFDVDADFLRGDALRLRFAQVNNQGGFQFGLDNVRVFATAIPEPAAIALVGIAGLLGLIRLFGRPRVDG